VKKKYVVNLSEEEKEQLEDLTQKGQSKARRIRRANILLLAHEGMKDAEIARALNAAVTTVERGCANASWRRVLRWRSPRGPGPVASVGSTDIRKPT
jgi:DNA invertase Pin-like site-specific DNA recombinase